MGKDYDYNFTSAENLQFNNSVYLSLNFYKDVVNKNLQLNFTDKLNILNQNNYTFKKINDSNININRNEDAFVLVQSLTD